MPVFCCSGFFPGVPAAAGAQGKSKYLWESETGDKALRFTEKNYNNLQLFTEK